MNLQRALNAACDGCTIYQSDGDSNEREPCWVMCFDNELGLVYEDTKKQVIVTPKMVRGNWLILKKWRTATEKKAKDFLAAGHQVRIVTNNEQRQVYNDDGVVRDAVTGKAVPMTMDAEWRVLR